jgi:hypothetical protein
VYLLLSRTLSLFTDNKSSPKALEAFNGSDEILRLPGLGKFLSKLGVLDQKLLTSGAAESYLQCLLSIPTSVFFSKGKAAFSSSGWIWGVKIVHSIFYQQYQVFNQEQTMSDANHFTDNPYISSISLLSSLGISTAVTYCQ